MDGITDCAYRLICKEVFDTYKHPEDTLMLWTEFMSADGYVHNPLWVVKHLQHIDTASPVIAQIFGGDKESLVACARDIDKIYHFTGIEVNMGCPSPKIYTCAAGSGMLRDKEQTLDIIKTIAESISTPFSIKTRIGLNQQDLDAQMQFLLNAAPYVTTITIHGRTFGQSHAGEVNRDFIYALKQQLPHHRIIGNGGLRSYQDAVSKLWNLDGMMRGQSAIGNPRILTPHTPTHQEIYTTMLRHLNIMMLCEYYFEEQKKTRSWILATISYQTLQEDSKNLSKILTDSNRERRSPVEFRKFLFCYINGLPGNKALKQTIAQTKNYQEVVDVMKSFFQNF